MMPKPISTDCPLAHTMATRLRAARNELTSHWLDRIAAGVTIDANRIFPTNDLLNHVPLLIIGVADYIEDPRDEVSADMPVVAKARELGALRHAQGFDAYQILKEFEIFGGVLFTYLTSIVETIDEPCTRSELLQCMHRLFSAVAVIQQATTAHFLELAAIQTHEREDRLRGFNRLVSHELKNTVHAIIGAHAMLRESFISDAQRDDFLAIIGRNADALQSTLANLLDLSRIESDSRQHKNILFSHAAHEAVRQIRETARAAGVTIHLREPFPPIEVNAAAIELCLTNYLSNAIKYARPETSDRWVEIVARMDHASGNLPNHEGTKDALDATSPCTLIVEVRDNGLGISPDIQAHLFQRFFRAHADAVPSVAGTGLGLSIVRETVQALGGEAWAAPNHPTGSVFGLTLPCRRRADVD
jgi:signal transduction histidine kinase